MPATASCATGTIIASATAARDAVIGVATAMTAMLNKNVASKVPRCALANEPATALANLLASQNEATMMTSTKAAKGNGGIGPGSMAMLTSSIA